MNHVYSQPVGRIRPIHLGLFLPNFRSGLALAFLVCFSWSSLMANNFSNKTPHLSALAETVSGTVTNDSGEALIGVSIQIKGTAKGTVTDFDGNYTLDVEQGNALIFSYTGYQSQEVVYEGQERIDVVLKVDAEVLDEVVVIGYGTVKKSNLTGAVASIDGSEITAVVAGNPTSALQGKVSGLQIENNGGEPGGDANVFIRGVSSLTNSFPLYVIDGTFADNMNYLNPKDIERIEVLKDASAAAIYGSRAANGVVIIQTKRGTQNSAPTITVDVRGGIESPDRMLDFLSGSEFVAHRNQLEQNDGTGFVLADQGIDTDWQDLSLNSGGIQDYGLSISGGGDNSRYFISGNWYNQDGILVSTGFERANFRANTEFTLGKFTLQQSLGYTRSEIERNNWFGRDGSSTAPILRENVPENEGGFEAPSFDDFNFAGQNKYGLASLEEHLETDNKLFGNFNVSYEIVEGLSAKINVGFDQLNRHNFAFRPTYFMSNSDPVDNVNQENDLTEIRSENLLTLIEPTLSYGKDIGTGRLDVVVGFTRQKIDFRSLGSYAQGLPNNNTQVIGAATPDNIAATLGENNVSGLISQFGRVNYSHDNKYLVSLTMRRDASSRFAEDNRVGYFPSASVGWNISNESFWNPEVVNRLKLRAGYGELGAQNIPNYAYQTVYNLNSNTSFGDQVRQGYAQTSIALEDLRWETAKTTNIGVDVGLLEDQITFSAEFFNKDVEDVLVGVRLPSNIGVTDPVIQNVGAITNRGFEFEGLYRIRTGGLNLNIGANITFLNSEVTKLPNVISGPSISEDLVRANRFLEGEAPGVFWGYIVDGVYSDQAAIDSDPNLAQDDERKAVVQPGDFIRRDINGDGRITGDDQTILGDPTPDFIYGLNFSGTFKNFDFGMFFQGTQGNEIYNATRFYNIFWADDNKLAEVKNAWTTENRDTDIPRATTKDPAQNGAPSSFFVEDGSYFRLRTLELGYNLDGLTDDSVLKGLRVFFTAQNLFTITGYSGYNPDISSVNGGRSTTSPFFGVPSAVNPLLGRGLDVRAYPNSRSFVMGVQATF